MKSASIIAEVCSLNEFTIISVFVSLPLKHGCAQVDHQRFPMLRQSLQHSSFQPIVHVCLALEMSKNTMTYFTLMLTEYFPKLGWCFSFILSLPGLAFFFASLIRLRVLWLNFSWSLCTIWLLLTAIDSWLSNIVLIFGHFVYIKHVMTAIYSTLFMNTNVERSNFT